MDAAAVTALVEESARRSGLVWVRADTDASTGPARPMWHVWSDGAVYVVAGGLEQPAPDGLTADGRAEVTVRSKDKQSRLVVWPAAVTVVSPGTEAWDVVIPLLQAKRLNAPDGEGAPQRWAAECTVFRLTPDGDPTETPDAPSSDSHAAPPPATPATTPVPQPWHLFGRGRKRRRKP